MSSPEHGLAFAASTTSDAPSPPRIGPRQVTHEPPALAQTETPGAAPEQVCERRQVGAGGLRGARDAGGVWRDGVRGVERGRI